MIEANYNWVYPKGNEGGAMFEKFKAFIKEMVDFDGENIFKEEKQILRPSDESENVF